ncbi:hypothetical protein M413DRAFT_410633 [Hebeloma cylindrosporum]|uniref:Uncharacterized protein n=1 Tax=Hebeloma cylindrosporum TaxID=76867 RepID=A0A0C3BZK8_HEBCY|nr:hypothetical protein M413DRAFT_410633 [Hebeloma cylindrosporum h7]
MPLHTAELHNTTPCVPGDYKSLLVLNPLRPSSGVDGVHVWPTSRPDSPEVDERARKGGFPVENMKLVLNRKGQYLEIRPDAVKDAAKTHTVLSVIFLLVGVGKVIIAQVLARNIAGSATITVPARVAADFFSFGGLVLDVLGAVLVLRSAHTLSRRANADKSIRYIKFNVQNIVCPGPEATPPRFLYPGGIPDGFLGLQITDHPLDINFGGPVLWISGFFSFVVSLCILVIATQGMEVGGLAVLGLPVFAMMAWSGINEMRGGTYVWARKRMETFVRSGADSLLSDPDSSARQALLFPSSSYQLLPLPAFNHARIMQKESDSQGNTQHAFHLNEEYLKGFSSTANKATKCLIWAGCMLLGFAAPTSLFEFATSRMADLPDITTVNTMLSFLVFSLLTFDAFVAVFAFTCARTLYKIAKEAKTIRQVQFDVCSGVVWNGLRAYKLPGSDHAECCYIPDDLRRILEIKARNSRLHFCVDVYAISTVVFLVRLLVFVIMTQSAVVWVPVAVITIITTVCLSVLRLQSNPRMLEGLPFTSGWTSRQRQRSVEGSKSNSVQTC